MRFSGKNYNCLAKKRTCSQGGHYHGTDQEYRRAGLDPADLEEILSVGRDLWKTEVAGIRDFYQQFGEKLPKELAQELENLEARLNA